MKQVEFPSQARPSWVAPLNPAIAAVTARVVARSQAMRAAYLAQVGPAVEALRRGPAREGMGCANLAHALAPLPLDDKWRIRQERQPNLGVVTAYNDMLSAHKPYEHYPELLREAARQAGLTVQVAGATPAMCDGITQGQAGMELSLWSRDVIAQSAAIALSHEVFDAALMLGVCDKIVPGLLIGAAHFGHLPTVFVPAGPMASGLSNDEKAKVRQAYAKGEVSRETLLEAELKAYHGEGTCTFYGTANSNQMLMEVMGLHLPGSAFVAPHGGLRRELSQAAVWQAARMVRALRDGETGWALGEMLDERSVVNAMVGLLATGGSTNHTLHLVAMARSLGIVIDWDDFQALSDTVPLLCRVYPNGKADVNQFHAAGGVGLVIRHLLEAGLLHADVRTVVGEGLWHYAQEPRLEGERLVWREGAGQSLDRQIIRPVDDPFQADGGVRLMQGRLGRAIFKASAVAPQHRVVEAPCRIFESQEAMQAAFKAGELHRDVVVVVRGQGPRANGMPELHKLTPPLAVLQDAGFRVALVTDGRMSGASGKVPAAIHVSPESLAGGGLSRLRDGDIVRVDADSGVLEVLLDDGAWAARDPVQGGTGQGAWSVGRGLFATHRAHALNAEEGACSWLG